MKKKPYIIHRPLADMHGDGVYFDDRLKEQANKPNPKKNTDHKKTPKD